MKRELTLQIDGEEVRVIVHREGDRIVVERDGERHEVRVVADRALGAGTTAETGAATRVPDRAGNPVAATRTPGGAGPSSAPAAGRGDVRAPMVGVIREVHVAVGTPVAEGERLVTMEAMKMDIYVNASVDGTVAAVHCKPGETTVEGAVLVTIAPAGGKAGAGGEAGAGGGVPPAGGADPGASAGGAGAP